MNIRSFGWRDLPLLSSYRNRGLFLDSSRVLIHGSIMVPLGALITFFGPSTRIYTYRCESHKKSGKPLIGQLNYLPGASYAKLSYLAPYESIEQGELSALSDYMAIQMGSQGAFHILADVDENNHVFEMLHQASFAIYARQRIWRIEDQPDGEAGLGQWRAVEPVDVIGVRSLYCNVVPGLVQQVEPLPKKGIKGVVYYQKNALQAYVELKYGRNGIWVQPFVNPDAEGFERHLLTLLQELPGRRSRPLYICVRSYQSWLELAIHAMGAQPGPQQAVMVRHLAITRRVNPSLAIPTMNGKRPEPTAPVFHIENSNYVDTSEMDKQPGSKVVV